MRRILGYDDLLTRLQMTLANPETGPAAKARLRSRYRVVLVDEFQDTDPVQWDILRLAFHDARDARADRRSRSRRSTPSEARTCRPTSDAAEIADHRATLAQNWRSDPELLRGLDALFRGAALGDPRIVVGPVSAARRGRSLDTARAPVRIRLLAGSMARR